VESEHQSKLTLQCFISVILVHFSSRPSFVEEEEEEEEENVALT
jgi:hypothetical protein